MRSRKHARESWDIHFPSLKDNLVKLVMTIMAHEVITEFFPKKLLFAYILCTYMSVLWLY